MTTEKDFLLDFDCMENTIKYIGDGVYAGFDGYQIWLVCRREADFHYIALDPRTFESLARFGESHHLLCFREYGSEPGEHQVVLDAIKD